MPLLQPLKWICNIFRCLLVIRDSRLCNYVLYRIAFVQLWRRFAVFSHSVPFRPKVSPNLACLSSLRKGAPKLEVGAGAFGFLCIFSLLATAAPSLRWANISLLFSPLRRLWYTFPPILFRGFLYSSCCTAFLHLFHSSATPSHFECRLHQHCVRLLLRTLVVQAYL